MKHDAAVRELTSVEESIRTYEGELAELGRCEMEYACTLKEKVKAIKAAANPEKAKSIADAVLNGLNNAEGWGTWDLLGGGLISDLAKYRLRVFFRNLPEWLGAVDKDIEDTRSKLDNLIVNTDI